MLSAGVRGVVGGRRAINSKSQTSLREFLLRFGPQLQVSEKDLQVFGVRSEQSD